MKKSNLETTKPKINEIINIETIRPNGRLRIQQDFQYCPTLAEQHSARETDLNYLFTKYKPDELAAYIAAKNAHKQEIIGHDFANEPTYQEARNITYNLKKSFEALPEDVRMHFKNHIEFLKFIDNPQNQEKMLKLGLMTKKQIENNTTPDTTTTTQEAKEDPKESSQSSSAKS